MIARCVNDWILELFFKFPCIVRIYAWFFMHCRNHHSDSHANHVIICFYQMTMLLHFNQSYTMRCVAAIMPHQNFMFMLILYISLHLSKATLFNGRAHHRTTLPPGTRHPSRRPSRLKPIGNTGWPTGWSVYWYRQALYPGAAAPDRPRPFLCEGVGLSPLNYRFSKG